MKSRVNDLAAAIEELQQKVKNKANEVSEEVKETAQRLGREVKELQSKLNEEFTGMRKSDRWSRRFDHFSTICSVYSK